MQLLRRPPIKGNIIVEHCSKPFINYIETFYVKISIYIHINIIIIDGSTITSKFFLHSVSSLWCLVYTQTIHNYFCISLSNIISRCFHYFVNCFRVYKRIVYFKPTYRRGPRVIRSCGSFLSWEIENLPSFANLRNLPSTKAPLGGVVIFLSEL